MCAAHGHTQTMAIAGTEGTGNNSWPPNPQKGGIFSFTKSLANCQGLCFLPPFRGLGGIYILSGTSIPSKAIPFLITLAEAAES
jgi:hypothetical protein